MGRRTKGEVKAGEKAPKKRFELARSATATPRRQ